MVCFKNVLKLYFILVCVFLLLFYVFKLNKKYLVLYVFFSKIIVIVLLFNNLFIWIYELLVWLGGKFFKWIKNKIILILYFEI